MPVYMVERDLPGIQMDQLAAAQKAAIETSNKFTAEGKDVRYIRTTFVPGGQSGNSERGECGRSDSLYACRRSTRFDSTVEESLGL
jgi:Nickel responsive protein SCO4226-like